MTEPAYMREVRAGRWQNAADMSGLSIQNLRLTHDDAYRKAHAVKRRRRMALGWTLTALGDRIDLPQSTLSNALTPSGHLSPAMEAKILAALARGESEQHIRQQELKETQ